MNNEIKEIIDKFDRVLKNYELDKKVGNLSVDSICHLFPSEMITIKDCITNLQEENDRHFKEAIRYENACDELEIRIDKAIEYIKEKSLFDGDLSYKEVSYLLNILEGDENDKLD